MVAIPERVNAVQAKPSPLPRRLRRKPDALPVRPFDPLADWDERARRHAAFK